LEGLRDGKDRTVTGKAKERIRQGTVLEQKLEEKEKGASQKKKKRGGGPDAKKEKKPSICLREGKAGESQIFTIRFDGTRLFTEKKLHLHNGNGRGAARCCRRRKSAEGQQEETE